MALSLGATLRTANGDHAGAALALHTAIAHEAGAGNRAIMANSLSVAALVLAGLPDTFEAAATLAGARRGPVLGVFPVWLTPPQLERYRRRLDHVAATLGTQRYADAQQRGAAMNYDQIVAYALDKLERLTTP